MILNSPYISGSLTVTGNEVVTGSLTVLGGITGVITGSATSASFATNASLLNGTGSGDFTSVNSFNSYTSSNDATVTSVAASTALALASIASLTSRTGSYTATSSFNSYTASNDATVTSVAQATVVNAASIASLASRTGSYATTGSNTFVGGQYFNSSFNPTGFTTTASLYTDGGLRVTRDAYISGTLYLNNVTVFGTQSVAYISSSQLNIGTNIITVNTDTPSVRFGGLSVYDSGSTGLTGSMLWDSQDNQWLYSNPSGSTYDSALFLVGPRNSGVIGNEVGISCNFLSKGNGMHHMTSSGIFEDGSRTCFYSNSFITSAGAACFASSVTATKGTFVGTGYVLDLNRTDNTALVQLQFNSAVGSLLGTTGANNFTVYNASAAPMLTLSGGVACFSNQICAQGATFTTTGNTAVTIASGATGLSRLIFQGTVGNARGFIDYDNSTCGFIIRTNENEALRITCTGNLGLGVTPSAWSSVFKVFEGGDSDSQSFIAFQTNANSANVGTNAFYDGAWKYKFTGSATNYQQEGGNHIWYQAPSGTAGNAITFCQAMTLNASGNLSIGNTNDSFKLDVYGQARIYQPATNTVNYLNIFNNRSRNAAVLTETTNGGFYAGTSIGTDVFNYQIYDGNAGSARLTISCTGAATFSSSVTAAQLVAKAGNGNQLILDNSAERFTQINLQNNATQKAAIWWDNTNTELVLLASATGTGHLKIASNGNTSIAGDLSLTPLNSALIFSSGFARIFMGSTEAIRISSTGVTCFACQVCTPYVSTRTIDVGGSASNPTEACIGYGMFGYSGVGLAISAGATGGNQGIGFFVCNVERGRWITNGNLGIGTVCPSSRLTVNGNASIFGHLSTDRYYTTRGLVASTSGNWVNLYQLPTNYNYVLLIHVRQPETFYTYTTIAYVYNYYNGANNYAFVESYVKNGSTSLQISGGYIQARQSSGSNASMYWDLTIFGTLDTNF